MARSGNACIDFLFCRFDPNEIGDIPEAERSMFAMEKSGCKNTDADYWLSGQDDLFNESLTEYFSILNNDLWELYISGRIAFAHLLEKVREPIKAEQLDEDRKLKAYQLKDDCFTRATAMLKSLDDIQTKLSPVEAVQVAGKQAIKRRKSVSAESFAMR